DLSILLKRHPGGYKRAAFLGRLDHDYAETKAGNQPIARGEVLGEGRSPERKLRNQAAAVLNDCLRQLAVFRRIDDVDPTAHHADSATVAVERPLMGLRVDTACEAAHDSEALGGEF